MPPPTNSTTANGGTVPVAATANGSSNKKLMRKSYRRETSEISCCLKYVIFSVNVTFWVIGLCILMVGFWAWCEKDIFNNLSRMTTIALDPAFILICGGAITFVVGLTGCVGALRENMCLLSTYTIFLATLLIMQLGFTVFVFIFKDKGYVKDHATEGLRSFITHYREDPDQQNLIDWIQEDWLQCCGIDGPRDWDHNNYFNCSSESVGSSEACGVPFSCCKRQPHELIRNKQCGYKVRTVGYPADRHIFERGCIRAIEDWLNEHLFPVASTCVIIMVLQDTDERAKLIHEIGCVQAGEEWMEHNLILLASSAIILAFLQILGICFAQNLRADIHAQRKRWH